jgi:hypothetical protein
MEGITCVIRGIRKESAFGQYISRERERSEDKQTARDSSLTQTAVEVFYSK